VYLDAQAKDSLFHNPFGLAYQGAGVERLFVADSSNNRIRQLDLRTMLVSTLVGTGLAGRRDGVGVLATLNEPRGVAFDGKSLLYIADTGNHSIRLYDLKTGDVSTIAGTGKVGSADGVGRVATFFSPEGLVWDATRGVLYVMDGNNHRIRVLKPDANNRSLYHVTTLAGSVGGYKEGAAKNALFRLPVGGVMGGANTLYIADRGNHCIRKLDLVSLTVTLVAGVPRKSGLKSGSFANSWFQSPRGLSYDAKGQALYVTEGGNNVIRKLDLALSKVSVVSGKQNAGWADGQPSEALFSKPYGIFYLPSSSMLYVADTGNHAIRVLDENAAFTAKTLSGAPLTRGPLNGPPRSIYFRTPNALLYDGKNALYIADSEHYMVRKLDLAKQTVSHVAGSGMRGKDDGSASKAQFSRPFGMALDASTNTLYIADSTSHLIRAIALATGQVKTVAGSKSGGGYKDGSALSAQLRLSRSIALDTQENDLYIADTGNHCIRKLDLDTKNVSTVAGICTKSGWADGQADKAQFSSPQSIAFRRPAGGGAAFLYIADTYNHCIRRLHLGNKQLLTVAGICTKGGWIDGALTKAKLQAPTGLRLRKENGVWFLWFVQPPGSAVRKVNLNQNSVSTVTGVMGRAGYRDGPLNEARYFAPNDVEFDSLGNVYILDSRNNLLRFYTP
jgi:DNA-binding beta-propeller fold protein YncE